ncbi:alkene reductase [Flavobacterium psychrotrophum]|uniref:alkene reductase n=1 Tax=Flavobacterium psychrotrophum TaxID=2294119 RepID=UPI000E321C74|nr:alkene reductase [Flavobacterium psychrotrophum]
MSTDKTPILFTPFDTQNISFGNRIVMAPMTRSRAINNIPNDLMSEYYAQRASAGLIITEGTSPSPNGLGYSRIPGIFSNVQIEGWKKITDAVHAKDSKIFIQLMHTGRVTHSDNLPDGAKIVAPSVINSGTEMWTDNAGVLPTETPEALSPEGVIDTIQEYVTAAKNAITAGFDGIELHSANGYLMEQFLNPKSNERTDEYGGSVENRARFVLEVAKAVADAIGKEKTGIRFSPYNTFNGMPDYDADEVFETYEYLAKEIDKMGLLYVHLFSNAAKQAPRGAELISTIRAYFKGILIDNGGFTKDKAITAIESHEVDMVAFGTAFLANPDLPYRLQNGIYLTQPEESTFYSADEKGYTDYPFA